MTFVTSAQTLYETRAKATDFTRNRVDGTSATKVGEWPNNGVVSEDEDKNHASSGPQYPRRFFQGAHNSCHHQDHALQAQSDQVELASAKVFHEED